MTMASAAPRSLSAVLKQQQVYSDAAWTCIWIVYIALFFRSMLLVGNSWPVWTTARLVTPLWPVRWISQSGWLTALRLLETALLGTTLLAALRPQWRLARIGALLAFVEVAALSSSFGRISHGFHMWIGVLAILILAPSGDPARTRTSITRRQQLLVVFTGVQYFILLCYTLSGVFKLGNGFIQLSQGATSVFHPSALAIQVANRLNSTNTLSMWGQVVIDYPLLGWPLYLLSIYMEACALLIVRRPYLHRLWALGLIGFHLGIWLTMSVAFFDNVFLVLMFVYFSPLAQDTGVLQTIRSWRRPTLRLRRTLSRPR